MDATLSNYQGHPPDDTWPGKTFMDYFTLAVSLTVVAIPVGFVLLHFALCADIYLDARERARRRDEVRAEQTRGGNTKTKRTRRRIQNEMALVTGTRDAGTGSTGSGRARRSPHTCSRLFTKGLPAILTNRAQYGLSAKGLIRSKLA
ncbi:hypothetical protein PG984_011639 [Apiospora sp. TS-2023a]